MPECPKITRWTAGPTKFDIAPQGTLCKVIKNDEATEIEYFIQVSPIQEDPCWLSAQDLLFMAYKEHLEDPEFIRSLLARKEEKYEPSDKTIHMQQDKRGP